MRVVMSCLVYKDRTVTEVGLHVPEAESRSYHGIIVD